MKLYSALIKKNKEGKIQDVTLLKEGFSLWAFLFSIFWFLYHKMWKESGALFVVSIALSVFEESKMIDGSGKLMIEVMLGLVIACNANYWLLGALQKKGYEFKGLVFGSDLINAKMRFIQNLEGEEIFDDSIVNPKLHRTLAKLQKQKPYFAV